MEDSDDDMLTFTITLEFELLFANAPDNLMEFVEEVNNKINKILEKHEK